MFITALLACVIARGLFPILADMAPHEQSLQQQRMNADG